LIRSVARDGIYIFCLAGNLPTVFLINDTRQARRVQRQTCQTYNRLFRF